MKFLVVDDEPDVEALFKLKFRKEIREGIFEFDFAFSGEEALSHLDDIYPDVGFVLSDINMPGMTGLELLRRIKSKNESLPVYMMTAYSSDEYRRQAEAHGSDGYIVKPVDFELLKALLQQVDAGKE